MKIQKYIKDKQNKYKVVIDDEEYTLYDDVIIKYNLLLTSELSRKQFDEILDYNDELKSYYDSIKYINRRLRSEKEIREYLEKKEVSKSVIEKTVERLRKSKFINDEIYLSAYFKDQINLTNNGPKKIWTNLVKLGIPEEEIKEKIESIDKSIWYEKIDKYIDKKIKNNHNTSSNMLKIKINNDLINLGYDREDIAEILNKKDIVDDDALKHEYNRAKRKYSTKFEGYELESKIKSYLFRKGFYVSDLKELDDEE